MTIKVAVWGPGSMGVIALRAVIDHPELELVDLVVHSDAKTGRDAGELCGIDPVGVLASQDPDDLLTGDADVVVYAAAGNLRVLEALGDMVRILRAGKNVVSCSVVPLVYPDAVDAAFTGPLQDAALAGGSSFFTTGIDTGFANDVLPLALSGISRNIDTIRVTEMFNYATYPDHDAVYEILGFGKPPEFAAIATLTGYVDGEPKFVVDHVTRMRDDIAPEWPQPSIAITPLDLGYGGASGRGAYRVEIEGSPSIRCELELAENHDHDLGARMAGASRMVNAIPAVAAAAPGLLSALDLPLITGKGLLKPVPGPSPDSRVVGIR